MTKSAATVLGPFHINVNAVCPGPTVTGLGLMSMRARSKQADISDEEVIQWRASMAPTGRLSQPEDIAGMAVFLVSPDAENITGQAYNVDGGLVTI